MEKKTNNGQNGASTQQKVAVGLGIAALAAAAAGAVFLYGTDAGKKKRKQIRGWMLKAKGEVLEKMESMKEWSEEGYNAIVDNVAKKYQNIKNVDPIEIAALVRDLKGHYKSIRKQVEGGKKKPAAKKKSSPTS